MPAPPNAAYLEWASEEPRDQIALDPNFIVRFGRGATNTIVLADDLVSRNHAIIECREDRKFFLTDLGSRNGTFRNGSRISSPTRLRDGDHISLGPYSFVFHDVETAQATREIPINPAPTVAHISIEMITVLVIDIRGYTEWCRILGTEKVTVFMAALFKEADTILRRHGVWAQKYIGDAVMAIWQHRPARDGSVLRAALLSAVEVSQALADLNARARLETPLEMGAGLNTGTASVGNIGSDGNADYTALGDSVNKAFRLEAATRIVNCDVLLGDATYQWLEPELRRGPFVPRSVQLKGYPDPETAWSISVEELGALVRDGIPARGHSNP
jgi:adenylate cyclase